MTKLFVVSLVILAAAGFCSCSGGGNGNPDTGNCAKTCATTAECPRDQYCAGTCCQAGCGADADCQSGKCNLDTHQCENLADGGDDGGADQGGADQGGGGQGGGDQGGGDQGGGDQGGGDQGGGDQGGGDQGGDVECPATHDKVLGETCECNEQCVADTPYCFADVLNDGRGLYCTISFSSADCTGQVCPENYSCNDFYVAADPPQPPFCAQCVGGTPKPIGEACLCPTDCAPEAPDCFKDPANDSATQGSCTIKGCTYGEGDNCPGIFECAASIDMTNQQNPIIYYCKACSPADHSLAEGTLCGCNKDCVTGAMCMKESLQGDKKCIMCLGGTPRGFGETCKCDSDCGTDFPTCLGLTTKYCTILNCLNDPSICPAGSTCYDFYGFVNFCRKA
jgi:hypothetical protein